MGLPAVTSSIPLDLFEAARTGDCDQLAHLLEGGAYVNACDRWDSTPLHYASLGGHAKAARMLLEAGAGFADDSTFDGERCYRAALNVGMQRLLRSYEVPPPPPLAPFPAALLRSAFLACPANCTAKSTWSWTEAAGAEPCRAPPDITLYVQGRPIEAHRVILAARSPYFRMKLTTEWRDRKEVTFSSSHSLSFELMRGLVEFFYCDRRMVPADDIEAWASLCKDCECEGILQLVNRSTALKTRPREPKYPQKRFLLQGSSIVPAGDRLPACLWRIMQDCLANSREEDNHDPVETCRSSAAYDDLADVRIKAGDRVFRCHQLFLALRSDYFKTRLSRRSDFHERRCDVGELPLLEEHDVSAEAFEKMLEYVYTDELKDLGDDPLIQAEGLMDVASRYLMFGLKQVVADLLLTHLVLDRISPTQLCRWLVLSDMYDIAKVRGHCVDIITCNPEAFAQAREFWALLPSDGLGDLFNGLRQMFG